nr:RNA-directed DNA polymerase, eukaryota, reverse transcriptase zinc-binding domain protein [Tanacetum cinerariifolium]
MYALQMICFMSCHGDKGSVSTLKEAIDEFGTLSGLKPNYDKSTIIFSSVHMKDKQEILECTPFKVEHLPIKYLGVPLTSKRIVLESIHIYWASVFLLPQTVINEINKILKGFLWNQEEMPRGNIITDKDSLWLKWISIVKLKGRSVWVVNEETSDSWGWKNILRLRDEVRSFIVMKIGNDEKASMMYDNWCGAGILHTFITHMGLYNVRMNYGMVMKDIVEQNLCIWPEEWIAKFHVITMHNSVVLNTDKEDSIVWRSRKGIDMKFSIKQAYQDLSNITDDVKWYKIVWFSQYIPKHLFILWLAIQNRLVTQDRIKKWGSYDLMMCPLCRKDMDSHKHLFFQCEYAANMWDRVKTKAGIKIAALEWNEIMDAISHMYYGNSIVSIIRRLSIAACVYLIWQERN